MLSQSFVRGGHRVAPWIFLKAELSTLVCRPLLKREYTKRQCACGKEGSLEAEQPDVESERELDYW